MAKPFDYSKWDNIELSDDEDDVHPNIDRESWFRLKHRSRVEREDNESKDKDALLSEVSVQYWIEIGRVCEERRGGRWQPPNQETTKTHALIIVSLYVYIFICI